MLPPARAPLPPQLPCAGNAFMAFNNRPATDSIPLLSPFIAPSIRALGPLLGQLATSPLRSNLEATLDMLKGGRAGGAQGLACSRVGLGWWSS